MASLDFEKDLDGIREELAKLRGAQEAGESREGELRALENELRARTAQIFEALTPWDRVQLARHPDRPHSLDYVERMFSDFIEMHGDRHFGDDAAIIGGPAALDGVRVMVVGHQKGRDTRENIRRNFGMASPEGFRKALRLMRQAEKFRLPVITLLDIPGASPVLEAEERGQAWAIADNLMAMIGLKVPIVVTVIGEGGSGGALALGVGDRVLMQEHSIYSVASPEGCASIVWRDHKFAPEAAAALKLTASDLLRLGIVDRVIAEPLGGAHRDYDQAAAMLKGALLEEVERLRFSPIDELLEQRHDKFRAMGRDLVVMSDDRPGS